MRRAPSPRAASASQPNGTGPEQPGFFARSAPELVPRSQPAGAKTPATRPRERPRSQTGPDRPSATTPRAAVREPPPKHPPMHRPGRRLVLIQAVRLKRRPPTICPGHVRCDNVRVQLRIAGSGQAVAVRRRDEPLAANPERAVAPPAREARLALDVSERLSDRALMRIRQRRGHGLVADREQHAHALRCRERQVERGDLCPPVLGAEPLSRSWVAAVHRTHEPITVNATRHSNPAAAGADPPARCLAAAGEVILEPLRHLRS